jgi:hypothetical protein
MFLEQKTRQGESQFMPLQVLHFVIKMYLLYIFLNFKLNGISVQLGNNVVNYLSIKKVEMEFRLIM